MRVLHVIAGLGASHGGPTVATSLMARACARAGMDVQVVSTNAEGRGKSAVPLDTDVVVDGVRYRYFDRDTHFYSMSRGLNRWLRHHTAGYDVVHTHALFNSATVVAARAARRQHVPYIVRPLGTLAPYGMTQHPWLKRISWVLFEQTVLKHAAAVHFTSTAERDEALRLGVAWRSEIVPLAVDVETFSTDRDKSWLEGRGRTDVPAFLFLSRLHEKKRVELLLQAFEEMKGRATLIVAGDGDPAYVARLRKLAEGMDVVWAGRVSGTEKRAVLAASDVFVLPSINENFGIAAVEAIASGLPCVLTSGVAVHREMEAADAAIISGGNASALAESMKGLLDPELRATMGSRARALAEQAFSLDALTQKLGAMYQRAVTR